MRTVKSFVPTLCVVAMLSVCTSAYADWNPGDTHKMHYPQLPDLTTSGIDVLATLQPTISGPNPQWKILADDFRCTQSGPIGDIHLWGSWLNDVLPQGAPSNVNFKLSIHEDLRPPTSFSRPGAELWSRVFTPPTFAVRPYATGVSERFYDPNTGQVIGTDNVVWQYNFTNIANPFIQEAGKIYWLDVQAQPLDSQAKFGWKTTNPQQTPHFEDDAVFGDTDGLNGALLPPGWAELIYPAGPFEGQSIDLAFVITPEPAQLGFLALGAIGALRRRK